MRPRSISASYLQNFVFGVEDALVSTVGLISGIAIAGVDKSTIFVTGVVLIFVEAFSMAVGSFLSGTSVERYLGQDDRKAGYPIMGGVIMFFSYFIAGFVPLSPYIVWAVDVAFPISIISSVIALFLLGWVSGRITRESVIVSAFRMAIIGAIAIGVGVFVGKLAS